jgi:hypothetical protein
LLEIPFINKILVNKTICSIVPSQSIQEENEPKENQPNCIKVFCLVAGVERRVNVEYCFGWSRKTNDKIP